VVLTGINAAAAAASAAAAVAIPARQLNHKSFAGGVAFDDTAGRAGFPDVTLSGAFSLSVRASAGALDGSGIIVGKSNSDAGRFGFNVSTNMQLMNSAATIIYLNTPSTIAVDTVYDLLIVREADDAVTLYVNGIAGETETLAGDIVIDQFGGRFSSTYLNGIISDFAILNTALTATQAAEIYAQGVSGWLASNPDYKWGATGFEDFENGENASTAQVLINTTTFNGTHTNYDGAGDADSIGGAQAGDFCAKIVTTGNHGFQISSAGANAAYTFVCELWFYIKTGDPNFNVTNSFAMEIKPQTNFSGDVTAKDAWTKVSFKWKTGVGNPGNLLVRINNGTMYIDSMTITRIGASLHLPMDEGIGLQLHDASTNHNDAILSATGTQHLIPKDAGHIRGFGLDASSNDFVGSASVDLIPADCVIDSLQIIDQGGETSSGTIIQRSDGSNHNGLHSGVALAADGSISAATTAAQIANDQRLRTATSSGATNIDVRANFKKLNS